MDCITLLILRDHPLVVRSRHSVMSRVDNSIFNALDLIEYADTAAHYEYLNLTAGDRSEGLSPEHRCAVAESWKIPQNFY